MNESKAGDGKRRGEMSHMRSHQGRGNTMLFEQRPEWREGLNGGDIWRQSTRAERTITPKALRGVCFLCPRSSRKERGSEVEKGELRSWCGPENVWVEGHRTYILFIREIGSHWKVWAVMSHILTCTLERALGLLHGYQSGWRTGGGWGRRGC